MKLPSTLLKQIALVGTTGVLLTTGCHFYTPSPIPSTTKPAIILHNTTSVSPTPLGTQTPVGNTPCNTKPVDLNTLLFEAPSTPSATNNPSPELNPVPAEEPACPGCGRG